jgi:hypothetical protein
MLLYRGIRVTENKTREGRAREKDNAVTFNQAMEVRENKWRNNRYNTEMAQTGMGFAMRTFVVDIQNKI